MSTIRSRNFFIAALAMLVAFTVQSAGQTLSGSLGKGSVKKGTTARGYVILKIPKGLHVNSYKPESRYAIPTRMTVRGAGVKAHSVTYPPGKKRKFPFSDTPISVYEGRAYLGFKVTVPKRFSGKTVRVKASVRYQACTDEVCYAPKTKTIWITAKVR